MRTQTFEEAKDSIARSLAMNVVRDLLQAKLAKIEGAKVANVASQFAEATSEELGWSPDDFVPIVTALSSLAQRAIATNKRMYLWNCL